MVSRHLREHLRTNYVEKNFIEALKFQKNTKKIKFVQK